MACSFGIFRLTDPPGLQTVLRCDEKEAFHYHPDLPIYTVGRQFPFITRKEWSRRLTPFGRMQTRAMSR